MFDKYRPEPLEKYNNIILNELAQKRWKLIYPDCGCVGKIPLMMIKNRTKIKSLEIEMDKILITKKPTV